MFANIEPFFLQVTGATLNGTNFDTHRQNLKKNDPRTSSYLENWNDCKVFRY